MALNAQTVETLCRRRHSCQFVGAPECMNLTASQVVGLEDKMGYCRKSSVVFREGLENRITTFSKGILKYTQ